jgi:hypothetical protein
MSKKVVHTMGLPTPINNWARSRSRLITSFSTYEMGTTLACKARTTDASITNSSNLAMLTVGSLGPIAWTAFLLFAIWFLELTTPGR